MIGFNPKFSSKENKMKKLITSVVLSCLFFNVVAFAGIDAKGAAYQGGTMKEKLFFGAKKPVEGIINTGDDKELKFEHNFNKTSGVYGIPYKQIIDVEYGQKAGRRVGAAAATTILLGPIGLLMLFSKKRKHYITIGYKDGEGVEQAAVFEIGKDVIRITLANIEARTGKKIVYQDDEAKKSSKSE
jgi:hypothetical protein